MNKQNKNQFAGTDIRRVGRDGRGGDSDMFRSDGNWTLALSTPVCGRGIVCHRPETYITFSTNITAIKKKKTRKMPFLYQSTP